MCFLIERETGGNCQAVSGPDMKRHFMVTHVQRFSGRLSETANVAWRGSENVTFHRKFHTVDHQSEAVD